MTSMCLDGSVTEFLHSIVSRDFVDFWNFYTRQITSSSLMGEDSPLHNHIILEKNTRYQKFTIFVLSFILKFICRIIDKYTEERGREKKVKDKEAKESVSVDGV